MIYGQFVVYLRGKIKWMEMGMFGYVGKDTVHIPIQQWDKTQEA
jgi:hypothetical protein